MARVRVVPVTLLLFGIALIILSGHAMTAHKTERWSAAAVFATVEEYASTGQGPCSRLIVASCKDAIVHDPLSPNYGKPSPQVRVFCQLSGDTGIMAVYGMYDPIGITGYAIRLDRWRKICVRDGCAEMDLTWLQRFLPGLR